MSSTNAKTVAHKVIMKVRNGEKVVLGEIIRDAGYSTSISKQPSRIVKTQSYQKEIAPFVTRMEKLRDKVLLEMDKKDLDKEQFTALSNSLRNLTHDIQLTRGKSTENIAIDDYRNLTNEELDKLLAKETEDREDIEGESKA